MKITWVRVLVFGLPVTLVALYAWMHFYSENLVETNFRPINSFCSDIPQTATPQQVIELAKQRGFEDASGDEREVWVFNHQQGPFFRFICIVKFEDHKLISKETIDGD